MSKNKSLNSQFPCCQGSVVVTGRKSKQQERGRFHTCKKCGQAYVCTVKGAAVVFTKS